MFVPFQNYPYKRKKMKFLVDNKTFFSDSKWEIRLGGGG